MDESILTALVSYILISLLHMLYYIITYAYIFCAKFNLNSALFYGFLHLSLVRAIKIFHICFKLKGMVRKLCCFVMLAQFKNILNIIESTELKFSSLNVSARNNSKNSKLLTSLNLQRSEMENSVKIIRLKCTFS